MSIRETKEVMPSNEWSANFDHNVFYEMNETLQERSYLPKEWWPEQRHLLSERWASTGKSFIAWTTYQENDNTC